MELPQARKAISDVVSCKKWASIFEANLEVKGDNTVTWKSNIEDLAREMRKNFPEVAYWDAQYGLWPGNSLCIFAAHSRWIHLATNTLPIYNVFPRLQGKFPS